MRNWKPFIADTIAAMKADGVERAVVICLAPQNSRTSVGLYRAALNVEGGMPFAVEFVESWHDHPLLIAAFAEKLRAGWDRACSEMSRAGACHLYRAQRSSAHHCGRRSLRNSDQGNGQAGGAGGCGSRPTIGSFAFQSQGMSGGAWLGPTVENTILELKEQRSSRSVCAAHRISLRSRRGAVRHRHRLQGVRREGRHAVVAGGIAE